MSTSSRSILRILVVIAIAVILLPTRLAAKNLRNRQVVLIGYSFSLDSKIRKKLSPYEELFPDLPRGVKGKDRVYSRLKALSYEMLKNRLEKEISLFIMPVNIYGRRFDYDDYGFPDTGIEKAQRWGDAKLYLKMQIAVEASPESSLFGSKPKDLDTELEPDEYLRPKIKVELTFYRSKGVIPYASYSSEMQWQYPLVLEPTVLDGLVNTLDRTDLRTLREALELGMSAIVEKIEDGK